jgi:enoyl-CoA hydratase/carnithine racemase
MNCLPVEATIEFGAFWKWYDAEPELRCAVFTGAGKKAFCAGMDLKQRLDIVKTNDVAFEYPQGGFGGMSNRTGKKPIIVALNGHAHGKIQSQLSVLDFFTNGLVKVAGLRLCSI